MIFLSLAEFLLQKHSQGNPVPVITPFLRDAMIVYEWPGNIRELENVMRKLVILRNPEAVARELQAATARLRTSEHLQPLSTGLKRRGGAQQNDSRAGP